MKPETRLRAKQGDFQLNSEEAYLWSRTLETCTLKDLYSLAPWEPQAVNQIVEALLKKAALENLDPPAARKPEASPPKTPPSVKKPPSPERKVPPNKSAQKQPTTLKPLKIEDLPKEIQEQLQMDRLDFDLLDLPENFRIEVLTHLHEIEKKNAFEVLGLHPLASESEIKQRYLKLSRSFHPDRYFRKDLGPYKRRLDLLFNHIQRAYGSIKNPHDREALVRQLKAKHSSSAAAKKNSTSKRDLSKLDPKLAMMGKVRHLLKEAEEFSQSHQYGKAYEVYQAALRLDPKNKEIQTSLERIQAFVDRENAVSHLKQAEEDFASEKTLKAYREASTAFRLDPKNMEAAFLAGKTLFLADPEQSKDAIELLKRAKAGLSKDVRPGIELMKIYHQLGESKKASLECQEILRRDPENALATRWKEKLR
ncbi:MAG: hypothetical protein EA369_08275 [Bradymonadales bacterium]|nr:MAG: hypothetical protein EA369_08275 [Bradymonadales bacterium]